MHFKKSDQLKGIVAKVKLLLNLREFKPIS